MQHAASIFGGSKVRIVKHVLALTIVAVAMTGCAQSISSDSYTTANVNQMSIVQKGTVVSARVVQVAGDSGAAGALTGAALGGIAGSAFGSGSGQIASVVGGAVVGGLVGDVAEKEMSKQTGVEYIVKLKNGSMVSIVQGPTPTFNRGQHVLVQYGGGRPRVIADPAYQ